MLVFIVLNTKSIFSLLLRMKADIFNDFFNRFTSKNNIIKDNIFREYNIRRISIYD